MATTGSDLSLKGYPLYHDNPTGYSVTLSEAQLWNPKRLTIFNVYYTVISLVWSFDVDGTHYKYPAAPQGRKGLVVLVDGTVAAHSDTIERLDVDLSNDAPWQ